MRVGIAVDSSSIRGLALRGSSITWSHEVVVAGDHASALRELLRVLPRTRWKRPAVCIALGPSLLQTRLLRGLPPSPDRKALADLVRENAGRFFLRSGNPLITSLPVAFDGGMIVAAMDQTLFSSLITVCRDCRFRVFAVVPAISVLSHGLEDRTVLWPDGDLAAAIVLDGPRIVALDVARTLGESPVPVIRSVLASVPQDAWRWAPAYGAAKLGNRPPLAVVCADAAHSSRVTQIRRRASIAACILATMSAVAAPAAAVTLGRARARTRLAALTPAQQQSSNAELELLRIDGALQEAATFDVRRRAATSTMSSIADALPENTALVSVRLDTLGGHVVALTPRAGALTAKLEHAPGLGGVAILGPVTSEVVSGRQLERVTVRFSFSPDMPR